MHNTVTNGVKIIEGNTLRGQGFKDRGQAGLMVGHGGPTCDRANAQSRIASNSICHARQHLAQVRGK